MGGSLVVCELASWTGIFQYRYVRHFKFNIIYIYIHTYYMVYLYVCSSMFTWSYLHLHTIYIYIYYIRTYTRWAPLDKLVCD